MVLIINPQLRCRSQCRKIIQVHLSYINGHQYKFLVPHTSSFSDYFKTSCFNFSVIPEVFIWFCLYSIAAKMLRNWLRPFSKICHWIADSIHWVNNPTPRSPDSHIWMKFWLSTRKKISFNLFPKLWVTILNVSTGISCDCQVFSRISISILRESKERKLQLIGQLL